jgi:hypothetical protein
VLSANGIDPVNLVVEFTRVIPASGNLTVCGQQFWLGRHRAGLTLTLCADTGTVELLTTGTKIKKVPFRLTSQHLQQLLAGGGSRIKPLAPPPHPGMGEAIEVDRTINGCGLLSLGGRPAPGWLPPGRTPPDHPHRRFCAAPDRRAHPAAHAAQPAHKRRHRTHPRRTPRRTRPPPRGRTGQGPAPRQQPRPGRHRGPEDPGRDRPRRNHRDHPSHRRHLPHQPRDQIITEVARTTTKPIAWFKPEPNRRLT